MDGVPFTFLGVHVALALATAGDADGLRRFAHNAARLRCPRRRETPARSGRRVWRRSSRATTPRPADALLRFEPYQWEVGGSRAQREVFEDTLIHALIRAGRLEEAATRLRARLDRRESALDSGLLAGTSCR